MKAHSQHIERFSHSFAKWVGTTGAFFIAIILTAGWIIYGMLFTYSNSWQTSFNSFTSITTFLMLFIIHRAQNKEYMAIQVKLNELISSHKGADNTLINIEEAYEKDIKAIYDTHRERTQKPTP